LEAIDEHTVVKKGGVVFNWGPAEAGETWTVDFRDPKTKRPPPGSWFVNREVTDTIILEHAEKLGCTVWQETSVETVEPAHGVTVPDGVAPEYYTVQTSTQKSITARWVVDATGQTRLLSRLWKLPLHKHKDLNNFALYGYWRTSDFFKPAWELSESERWGLFSVSDDGWVWFIPIDEDIVSVGLVTDKETLSSIPTENLKERYFSSARSAAKIDALLENATYLGDRPDGSRPERVSAIQDWSYRSLQSCGPGWFVVGDSAMFVDPVLSSGLFLAARGASMVANAITTLVRTDADVDLLCASYQQTYSELADAYVRMAKVWYQRNTRMDSWHWQAQRERLRAGAPSLYERDQDAFTALALGAMGSPLDATLKDVNQEAWGTEFFIWFTASQLFAGSKEDDSCLDNSLMRGATPVVPTDPLRARDSSRREVAGRWRALLYSRPVIEDVQWENRERYHTHEAMEVWERVQYIDVEPKLEGWDESSIIFPCTPDMPSSVLPHLDGSRTTMAIIQELLDGHPLGSKGRDMRVKMVADMMLRLQMMGLLQNVEEQPAPPRSNHTLFKVLIPSVLKSLDVECQVLFELDWLGESCTIRFLKEEQRAWMKCFDLGNIDPSMLGTVSASSALRWSRFDEPWFQRFVEAVRPRLDTQEKRYRQQEGRSHWEENRDQAGIGLCFDFKPGTPLTARLF